MRSALKEDFSFRELGVSHGVMFCHDASPQRQEQPAGSQAEKWLKKRGFLEVKKLRCFWLNHVRGTETQQNAPAAE